MIIGIDNGLDGGIVILTDTGSVHAKYVMPVIGVGDKGKRTYDIAEIVRLMKEAGRHSCSIFLERAQAMPGQGVTSMFSIGYGYGVWQGILTALGLRYEIVGPQTWQKEVFAGIDRSDTKKASAIIAKRLSPDTDWRATERSKIPHSGLTDAYCIADYGMRRLGQKDKSS